MSVTAIKRQDKTESDPGRGALAAAITAHREAVAAHEAALQDFENSRSLAAAAEEAVEAAKVAIDGAKREDAEAAANAVRTKRTAAGASATKRARREAEDAADVAEVATAAAAKLKEAVAETERQVRLAANGIIVARNEVLRPICEAMLHEARTARRTLAIVQMILVDTLNGDDPDAPRFDENFEYMVATRAREERRAPLVAVTEQVRHFVDESGERRRRRCRQAGGPELAHRDVGVETERRGRAARYRGTASLIWKPL